MFYVFKGLDFRGIVRLLVFVGIMDWVGAVVRFVSVFGFLEF